MAFRLGDFGLAFPTNKDDKTNPIMWSERGTPGHFAPEQSFWINDVTQEPYEVSSELVIIDDLPG